MKPLVIAAASAAAVLVSASAAPAAAPLTATVLAQTDLPTFLTVDSPSVLLGTKVLLSGTGDPNSRVDFEYENSTTQGHYVSAGHKTTNADGSFSIGTTPTESTGYAAVINGKLAAAGVAPFTKIVRLMASPTGSGKVLWEVNGAPSRTGYINIYRQDANGRFIRLGHIKSDKYGDGALVTTSEAGPATFKAGFQVPQVVIGTTTLTVTVQ